MMANEKLLEVFENTKKILCRYNYYIHIPKKTIFVTNSENMIPHLMGMQYIGKTGMFTGDKGAYLIKKGRLKYKSLEKLVTKYYRNREKQDSIIAMLNSKINNLCKIEDMLSTYSVLYLYDIAANSDSELKTNYLLVNSTEKIVLQLGLVRTNNKKIQEYHCNTFMVSYKKNTDYDLHYRNLTHCYEISKIVREDKLTKRLETIYQSKTAANREKTGVRKMFAEYGIHYDEKLVESVIRLNRKFGIFHTMDMLLNIEQLINKCQDISEEVLVKDLHILLLSARSE